MGGDVGETVSPFLLHLVKRDPTDPDVLDCERMAAARRAEPVPHSSLMDYVATYGVVSVGDGNRRRFTPSRAELRDVPSAKLHSVKREVRWSDLRLTTAKSMLK